MKRSRYARELQWLASEKYGGRPDPASILERDITRILSGEPVDYVIGWKPFLNCHIDLSKRPLIPRAETEYWTERFIEAHRDAKRAFRVLDMFAGSGCIGIAILKNIPNARVDFADSDPRCIVQIKINLKINNIAANRARIITSNIFLGIRGEYDAIVANPPYVSASRKKQLSRSVTKFEPRIAVFGGNDGLKCIRAFLRDAKSHSNPAGEIWMEFDTKERRAIAVLAKKIGYAKCDFKKDQYEKIRYCICLDKIL